MIVLSRERRIDWSRVVENLRKTGMSTAQIADRVGISIAAVKVYKNEGASEPAHWAGSALLLLWAERTGCKWDDAPTRAVAPSVSDVLRDTA